MGYVVLHLDKSPSNESAMTDHIERNKLAPNVDPTRTHLNQELIEFPEGVKDRTEAIQHRIKNVGLSRKVGKNQVQVIRFILSGSTKEMLKIQAEGKLDDWCRDSMNWLKKEYGEKNVVAATLHLDEDAPHIHASVVPIVQGERREKKSNKKQAVEVPQRQYKKKKTNRPRLCADDIMSRAKLKEYQSSYAEAMQAYGLQRGVDGSEARHITTAQYYRNLFEKKEDLQEDIQQLLKEKEAKEKAIKAELEEKEKVLRQVKNEVLKVSFEKTAKDVGTSIMEGLGSMIGASKVKIQQQEIESLKADNGNLTSEIKELKQYMQAIQKEHETVVDKLKQELKKIHDIFPKIKELLRIENICKHLGFGEELTKMILEMKPVGFKGKLYSSEYQRHFETEKSEALVKQHPTEANRLQLTIDGVSDVNWFRLKYREFQKSIGIDIKPKQNIEKNKGFRM